MCSFDPDLVTTSVSPQLTLAHPTDRMKGYSLFDFRVSYVNRMPHDVTVGWRNGLRFVIPSDINFEHQNFVVRVDISVAPGAMHQLERYLSTVNPQSSPELKCFRDAFERRADSTRYGGTTLSIEYPISLDVFKKNKDSFYCSEIDAILSLKSIDRAPCHPYSTEGQIGKTKQGVMFEEAGRSFALSIDIVDNTKEVADRYLNVNGTVYKLTPIVDTLRRDGVYVTSLSASDSVTGGDQCKYYRLEDSESELGLYKTREQAESAGDVATHRKHEISRLEHDLNVSKVQQQREMKEHELAMADKDRRLREMQDRYAMLDHEMKLEQARRKDYYETRAFDRKEESELLKYLPSVIVGLGGIFIAVKTVFGSK